MDNISKFKQLNYKTSINKKTSTAEVVLYKHEHFHRPIREYVHMVNLKV